MALKPSRSESASALRRTKHERLLARTPIIAGEGLFPDLVELTKSEIIMKAKVFLMTLTALGFLPSLVYSQNTGASSPPSAAPTLGKSLWQRFDTNHDRKLQKAEISAWEASLSPSVIARFDRNKDGRWDAQERKAALYALIDPVTAPNDVAAKQSIAPPFHDRPGARFHLCRTSPGRLAFRQPQPS